MTDAEVESTQADTLDEKVSWEAMQLCRTSQQEQLYKVHLKGYFYLRHLGGQSMQLTKDGKELHILPTVKQVTGYVVSYRFTEGGGGKDDVVVINPFNSTRGEGRSNAGDIDIPLQFMKDYERVATAKELVALLQ